MKALLTALAVCFAVPAWANNCAPREIVSANLTKKFGESRIAYSVSQKGVIIEIYASDKDGTWTIITTTPTGISCQIMHGTDFESVNPEPTGEKL